MTVYAIGQISIHDRERYDRYVAGFRAVLKTHAGRLLVADERPEVVQGHWGFDKIIVIAFPDAESFHAWETSPEYREIAKDRIAATEGVILLARAVESR